jgi:hypothetical protein
MTTTRPLSRRESDLLAYVAKWNLETFEPCPRTLAAVDLVLTQEELEAAVDVLVALGRMSSGPDGLTALEVDDAP